ncbi:DUF1543 domain-containing protein [Mucilaginibacter sp.]|uniref:DUF1543 domain-containing protein n=1 Tax=Mucilaginibacter sp. TaxID=1882438 RepID=UPI003D095B2E
MQELKLYMILIGCRPKGRHVEQHDIFFGIAASLKDLIPEMRAFWREAADNIHIDAWREVNVVDGYQLKISLKTDEADEPIAGQKKLFFINLGGYQENKFEEQHYTVLTVKDTRLAAYKEAKQTLFYQHNHFERATSHIDDKYGIDVDDLYQIEEILSPIQKQKYRIELLPAPGMQEDKMNLGYLKLSILAKGQSS